MTDIILNPRISKEEARWSLFSWSPTTQFKSVFAEVKLLARQLTIGTEGTGPVAEVGMVDIGNDRFINTLVINSDKRNPLLVETPYAETLSPSKRKNLVIAHGYGAGMGFFFRNYAALTHSGYTIHSIDWLGMANSSRPPFPKVKRGETEENSIAQAEEFFIESLGMSD
jgi:pimeloyl-ACP methyl ester carboxylesterase